MEWEFSRTCPMPWCVGGPTPAGSARPSRSAASPTMCGNCWTAEGPCFESWSKAFRPRPSFSLP
eukprot:1960291-Alexandrium_andersonii.AAC.1